MIQYRFSTDKHQEFAKVLRERVRAYFAESSIDKAANTEMVVKTIVAFAGYILPLVIMLVFGISSIPLLIGLWLVMGFNKAFIGTSVMHDALHGSYTKRHLFRKILPWSAVFVGADPELWKIQHNKLHHTYTNIEHVDDDIQPRFLFRFTPHQKRRWFHRFQHLYAGLFYSLSTLTWVLMKDFRKCFEYRDLGLIERGSAFNRLFVRIILRKVLYFGIFLVLPMVVLPVSPWWVLLFFVLMHMVAGFILTIVFQTAHIMPTSEFTVAEDGMVNENWLVHQLQTTSNYAMNSKVLSWFIGGLNFQIEHHLFPNICHVHYAKIAAIVQKTAKEFELPYFVENTFREAIASHFLLLKTLGRYDVVPSRV